MIPDRATLHVSRLVGFSQFAAAQGYKAEPTKAAFEVLRLRKGSGAVLIFHKRTRTDHITVSQPEALRSFAFSFDKGEKSEAGGPPIPA